MPPGSLVHTSTASGLALPHYGHLRLVSLFRHCLLVHFGWDRLPVCVAFAFHTITIRRLVSRAAYLYAIASEAPLRTSSFPRHANCFTEHVDGFNPVCATRLEGYTCSVRGLALHPTSTLACGWCSLHSLALFLSRGELEYDISIARPFGVAWHSLGRRYEWSRSMTT
ncbi:hypothetical protein PSPO01_07979 [Paraphaeosphaeria sporulosa]